MIKPLPVFEKLLEIEDDVPAVPSAFNFINKSRNVKGIQNNTVAPIAISFLILKECLPPKVKTRFK